MILGKQSKNKIEDLLAECLKSDNNNQDEVDGFLLLLGSNMRKLSRRRSCNLQKKFLNEVYDAIEEEENNSSK